MEIKAKKNIRISTFLAGIRGYFIAQEISATVYCACHNNINNKVVERAGIGHKLTFGVVRSLAWKLLLMQKKATQKGGEITLNK